MKIWKVSSQFSTENVAAPSAASAIITYINHVYRSYCPNRQTKKDKVDFSADVQPTSVSLLAEVTIGVAAANDD